MCISGKATPVDTPVPFEKRRLPVYQGRHQIGRDSPSFQLLQIITPIFGNHEHRPIGTHRIQKSTRILPRIERQIKDMVDKSRASLQRLISRRRKKRHHHDTLTLLLQTFNQGTRHSKLPQRSGVEPHRVSPPPVAHFRADTGKQIPLPAGKQHRFGTAVLTRQPRPDSQQKVRRPDDRIIKELRRHATRDITPARRIPSNRL